MKTFNELTRHLNWLGILQVDSTVKEQKLKIVKNCVAFFALTTGFISTVWYRLFNAKSVHEITESNYFTLSWLLYIGWYSALFWHCKTYAAIFDELDTTIEQSKYQFIDSDYLSQQMYFYS